MFNFRKKTIEEKVEDIAIKFMIEKIWKDKEDEFLSKEQELEMKDIQLRQLETRLRNIDNGETQSLALIMEKKDKYEKEMHENMRKTNREGDTFDIKAKASEEVLKFILWLTKK